MTATASEMMSGDARARRNVFRLAIAQALAGANSAVIMATGSIIGVTFAPTPSLATLPISTFIIGLAAGTLPTGIVSRRYGRRTAFLIGAGCGMVCSLIAAAAIVLGSFALFCGASFVGGLYSAVSQSYRFAASDGASAEFRPKAISWVMAGGVFAGILGPQVVEWTTPYWPQYLFAASFCVQAVIALIAMTVLAGVDAPPPPAAELAAGRPLLEIVRQSRFIVAALCGVIAYTMMNLVMTSAPLAMKMCGLTLSDSNFGLQWHFVGMFGPSFFTGLLIARFGAQTMVAVGLLLEAVAAAIGLAGISAMHFWVCLFVLGFGWNFAFVSATAMIVETHRPEERNKTQACNDFLVFGTVAVGSLSSGQLLASYGWTSVNLVVLPFVAVALMLLAAGAMQRRAVTA